VYTLWPHKFEQNIKGMRTRWTLSNQFGPQDPDSKYYSCRCVHYISHGPKHAVCFPSNVPCNEQARVFLESGCVSAEIRQGDCASRVSHKQNTLAQTCNATKSWVSLSFSHDIHEDDVAVSQCHCCCGRCVCVCAVILRQALLYFTDFCVCGIFFHTFSVFCSIMCQEPRKERLLS